jgi:hypothetical protein
MKHFLFIIFSLILFTFFQACNKYEEGPFLSLKSAEKRIAGDYIVDKYLINGEEISLIDIGISQYRVVYYKDGTGKSYITSNDFTYESDFEWELDEKKLNIRTREKGQTGEWSAWSDYKIILKLTNEEFWVKDGNETESQEFHFIESDNVVVI